MRVSELIAALSKQHPDARVMLDLTHNAFRVTEPIVVRTEIHSGSVVLCNYFVEHFQPTITCEGVEYESVQRTWGRGRE